MANCGPYAIQAIRVLNRTFRSIVPNPPKRAANAAQGSAVAGARGSVGSRGGPNESIKVGQIKLTNTQAVVFRFEAPRKGKNIVLIRGQGEAQLFINEPSRYLKEGRWHRPSSRGGCFQPQDQFFGGTAAGTRSGVVWRRFASAHSNSQGERNRAGSATNPTWAGARSGHRSRPDRCRWPWRERAVFRAPATAAQR